MNNILTHTVDTRPRSVVPTFGYVVTGCDLGMFAGAAATADIAVDQGTTVWRPPSC